MGRRALDSETMKKLKVMDFGLFLNSYYGWAKAGQLWKDPEGELLIIMTSSYGAYYFQNGKIYFEDAASFIGRVTTAPFVTAAQNSLGSALMAEMMLQFGIGMLGGAGIAPLWATSGAAVFKFLVENNDKFSSWIEVATAIASARALLKKYAPTFYDKLFWAALYNFTIEIGTRLPEGAVASAQDVAASAGSVVGKFGEKAFKGELTVGSAVCTLLLEVVIHFAKSIPKAVDITVGDMKDMATKFIKGCKDIGLAVSKKEVAAIFKEVLAHGPDIEKVLMKVRSVAERCQDINSTIAQAKSTMAVMEAVGKVAVKEYAGY